MGELDLDSILSPEEIENLFNDDNTGADNSTSDNKTNNNNTTENDTVNPEELFSSESVGSGNKTDTGKGEDTVNTKGNTGGSSPNNSKIYSSIASALKDEGIFPDLDDESVSKIETPEDFAEMFESQINARLDEKQRRIDSALSSGVEPNEIKQYEDTIDFLDSIKDDQISDESDNGERLRKQLIYTDFINRGYSKERANREVKKSFDSGTDIEDAKEALASNKDFYKSAYKNIISEAEKSYREAENERKKNAEALKKDMLENDNIFGSIPVDKSVRQKAYDAISKPVYKDPDTGELFTAIQKYEMDNRMEFLKNVGFLYTLTDGFKNIDKLVKGKVRTEMKKGFRDLENTINSTSRTSDGNLRFANNIGDDPDSYIGKGIKLDL